MMVDAGGKQSLVPLYRVKNIIHLLFSMNRIPFFKRILDFGNLQFMFSRFTVKIKGKYVYTR